MAIDATNSFITDFQDLRSHLGLEPGEDVDRLFVLEAIINRVAVLANTYTGRNLKQRSYANQLLDGSGTDCMFLPQFPVTASSVVVKVDAARAFAAAALERWDQTSSSGASAYTVTESTGELLRIDGSVWPSVAKSVKASFTAGLTAAAAPDLVGGILEECADWYHRIGRDPHLSQASEAGLSQSFVAGTGPFSGRFAGMSAKVRQMLDPYSVPALAQ